MALWRGPSRERDRGSVRGAVGAGRVVQPLWPWSRWEAVRWQWAGGGGGQREESRSHPGGTLLGPGCCSAMGHPRTVQGWAGAGLKGRGRQALQSDGFQGKKAA